MVFMALVQPSKTRHDREYNEPVTTIMCEAITLGNVQISNSNTQVYKLGSKDCENRRNGWYT
jgi:hypothetical protein